MRKFVSLVLIICLKASLLLSQNSPAPQPEAGAANVPQATPGPTKGFGLLDGTPVRMRTGRTVSSADAKTGDTVDFEVLEEVLVEGVVVIPKGGIALATVTDAQPKRRLARGGKLDINIDSARMVTGDKVALRAVKEGKGGSHTGVMTGAMVATGIVFFPAAPLFLFMKGKDITIPKGTEITAYVAGDMKLERAKFEQANHPASGSGSEEGVLSPSLTASPRLNVVSTPPGADISVDGSFVGSTPSEIDIAPGDHTIALSKSGFKPWEKKLKVSGGKINLNADLESLPN